MSWLTVSVRLAFLSTSWPFIIFIYSWNFLYFGRSPHWRRAWIAASGANPMPSRPFSSGNDLKKTAGKPSSKFSDFQRFDKRWSFYILDPIFMSFFQHNKWRSSWLCWPIYDICLQGGALYIFDINDDSRNAGHAKRSDWLGKWSCILVVTIVFRSFSLIHLVLLTSSGFGVLYISLTPCNCLTNTTASFESAGPTVCFTGRFQEFHMRICVPVATFLATLLYLGFGAGFLVMFVK